MAASRNPAGRPPGIPNADRGRRLKKLEELWPGCDPVIRIMEQAEKVRGEYLDREERHVADLTAYVDGRKTLEEVSILPTPAERDALCGMYAKAAPFLVPKLKDVTVDHQGLGDFTMTLKRGKRRK